MLEIYLPIAQVNVDIFLLLFLSLAVGILSGLFGVGGGFLMTPFLIFMGIPPVYAVPNEVNNILATSVSGSLTHWYKNVQKNKSQIINMFDERFYRMWEFYLLASKYSFVNMGNVVFQIQISKNIENLQIIFKLHRVFINIIKIILPTYLK